MKHKYHTPQMYKTAACYYTSNKQKQASSCTDDSWLGSIWICNTQKSAVFVGETSKLGKLAESEHDTLHVNTYIGTIHFAQMQLGALIHHI